MKGIELISETVACPSCGGTKHRVVRYIGAYSLRTVLALQLDTIKRNITLWQGECRTCFMRGPVRDCPEKALESWLAFGIPAEAPTAKASSKIKTCVVYPDICKHAEILGVSRIHLYYVLRGDRKSPRIEAYIAKHNLWGKS